MQGLTLVALFLCIVSYCLAVEYQMNWQWVKTAGSTGSDEGKDIAADKTGNIYVVGSFSAAMTFANKTLTPLTANSGDGYLLKYSSSGEQIWMRQMSSKGNGKVNALAVVDDSLYITGYFTTSMTLGGFSLSYSTNSKHCFVAKLDTGGNAVWVKNITSSQADECVAISYSNSDNSVVVTGIYANFDGIVAKIDADTGAFQWTKTFGVNEILALTLYDVVTSPSGLIYLCGSFGKAITLGTSTLTPKGSSDFLVFQMDSSGSIVWATSGGGLYSDTCNSLALPSNDVVIATGYFSNTFTAGTSTVSSAGSLDIVSMKLSSTGDLIWLNRAGGKYADTASGSTHSLDGGFYTAGYFSTLVTFGNTNLTGGSSVDIAIVKCDESGNPLTAIGAGGASADWGTSVYVSPNNTLLCTGYFHSSITINGTVLSGLGGNDIFIGVIKVSEVSVEPSPSVQQTPIESSTDTWESPSIQYPTSFGGLFSQESSLGETNSLFHSIDLQSTQESSPIVSNAEESTLYDSSVQLSTWDISVTSDSIENSAVTSIDHSENLDVPSISAPTISSLDYKWSESFQSSSYHSSVNSYSEENSGLTSFGDFQSASEPIDGVSSEYSVDIENSSSLQTEGSVEFSSGPRLSISDSTSGQDSAYQVSSTETNVDNSNNYESTLQIEETFSVSDGSTRASSVEPPDVSHESRSVELSTQISQVDSESTPSTSDLAEESTTSLPVPVIWNILVWFEVKQGVNLTLSPSYLSAYTNVISDPATVIYTVHSIEHARLVHVGTNISPTSFSQLDVNNGLIVLLDDGSSIAPVVSFRITAGSDSTPLIHPTIIFWPHISIRYTSIRLQKGTTTQVLTSDNLSTSDIYTVPSQIAYTIHSQQSCSFKVVGSGSSVYSITQEEVNQGQIIAILDNGSVAASFVVSSSNGVFSSAEYEIPVELATEPEAKRKVGAIVGGAVGGSVLLLIVVVTCVLLLVIIALVCLGRKKPGKRFRDMIEMNEMA